MEIVNNYRDGTYVADFDAVFKNADIRRYSDGGAGASSRQALRIAIRRHARPLSDN